MKHLTVVFLDDQYIADREKTSLSPHSGLNCIWSSNHSDFCNADNTFYSLHISMD